LFFIKFSFVFHEIFHQPINETLPEPSQYIERLNGVKTLCNAQILEEETIKKKALQEISLENQSRYFGYPGNQFFSYYDDFNEYPYGNRPSQSRAQDPEVQRKLQTDRMLKKQQEEEYKLAQRLAEEQQTKKQKEIDEKKLQEERKRIEEEEKVNFEKIQQEALKQKRAQLQPEPPIGDPDLFEVLFRLPNGNKISRRFRKSDGIEVFFFFKFI
jgi:flagellar biosynthesis GTPase FlhF